MRLIAMLLVFVLALFASGTAVASTDDFGSINQFEMDVGPVVAERVSGGAFVMEIGTVKVDYASSNVLANIYFVNADMTVVDHNLCEDLLVNSVVITESNYSGNSGGGVTDRLIFPLLC
jgi:hypothetical protein